MGYDYKRMDHSSSQSDFMKGLDKLENLIALLVKKIFAPACTSSFEC